MHIGSPSYCKTVWSFLRLNAKTVDDGIKQRVLNADELCRSIVAVLELDDVCKLFVYVYTADAVAQVVQVAHDFVLAGKHVLCLLTFQANIGYGVCKVVVECALTADHYFRIAERCNFYGCTSVSVVCNTLVVCECSCNALNVVMNLVVHLHILSRIEHW